MTGPSPRPRDTATPRPRWTPQQTGRETDSTVTRAAFDSHSRSCRSTVTCEYRGITNRPTNLPMNGLISCPVSVSAVLDDEVFVRYWLLVHRRVRASAARPGQWPRPAVPYVSDLLGRTGDELWMLYSLPGVQRMCGYMAGQDRAGGMGGQDRDRAGGMGGQDRDRIGGIWESRTGTAQERWECQTGTTGP